MSNFFSTLNQTPKLQNITTSPPPLDCQWFMAYLQGDYIYIIIFWSKLLLFGIVVSSIHSEIQMKKTKNFYKSTNISNTLYFLLYKWINQIYLIIKKPQHIKSPSPETGLLFWSLWQKQWLRCEWNNNWPSSPLFCALTWKKVHWSLISCSISHNFTEY